MVWPGILSTVALFVGFHQSNQEEFSTGDDQEYSNREAKFNFINRVSRFDFFWMAFIGCFLYSWLPQYFFVVLQSLSPLCLLGLGRFPNLLFSSDNGYGIGLGTLTFDWYFITGLALTTPFWAYLNLAISNFFWGWFLTPIMYLSNAFGNDQGLKVNYYSDGTPIPVLNSVALFNSTGYRISAVSLYQTPSFDLNETKYAQQAPIYLTTFFALSYGASFLSIMAAFMHVYLWHGTEIYKQFTAALKQIDNTSDTQDIHNKLMKAYPDIPEKAFLVFLVFLIVFQVLTSSLTAFEMPWWAILLSTLMSMISILPIGIITAISGQTLGLNVLSEFVIGLMLPGKTVVVMAFKSLVTNSVKQAIILLSDLKLGHYMKINPRHMVFAQLYGSFLGAFVNTWTTFWVLDVLPRVLGTGEWRATNFFLFYNAGAIWFYKLI